MSDFNSSLPVRTETNGDVAAKIVDATVPSQGLLVNPDGSINVNSTPGSADVNVHDSAGNTITSTGTSLDVNVTNPVSVTQGTSPWVVSGTVTSNIGTTGGLALDTTVAGLLTDTQLRASPVPISGTVTANAGTGNFTVVQSSGANLHVNVDNFPADADALAQGSTTAGQLGALIMGAVTTAAPSYTTGQTDPLSLTLSGALRVDGSATTQPISGTVTANQGTSPWVVSGTVTANIGTTGGLALDSSLSTINTTLGTLLTDTQLRASPVPISGTVAISNFPTYDTDYGTVGANTLRTASQIGNATGAADFNAGATGAQTLRVTANQGAPGTNANAWFVHPTDGTNNQVFTATGQATVIITSPLPAGTNSIGTVVVSNFPTTVDTNYGTVGANTIRTAAQIGNATGAADFNNGATGAQTLRVAANLAVGGANVTLANPVPVTINDVPGVHINNFKDATAIAAGASDNHDYTVTAATVLHLNQIESSASGKAKMEIQVETGVATGSFSTKWVQFNSTANPNMHIEMEDDILVAAGVRVRVIMTNKDNQAQDLYSTISGYEL